ncbi:hypothetical protein VII00023_10724 [Vibrio ichthyoenteri ATCC 700023]|uniref:Uncharacterized protein n=1 Tax=Vibrio ichthyoenteri ATCC 700023 TaxID=870968 RepID=F9S8X1_9VIBR|nr:hypothetical protein [Vibrio ichthyoenteri]EGU29213.1 hypothetical protein VII00023_10724 [Vibrio ichthyoenteri ATCC 700023]
MSTTINTVTLNHQPMENHADWSDLLEGEWYYVINHNGHSSVGQWRTRQGCFYSQSGDNIDVTKAKEIIKVAELRLKNSREFPLCSNPFIQRRNGFKVLMEVPRQGFLLINCELAMSVDSSFPFNYTMMP